jgi:hypothetical protein
LVLLTAGTLKAITGWVRPFNMSGPSCSVSMLPFSAALTRWLSRIWPSLALSTNTGGDITHRADRRVAGTLRKADLAQGRIALHNTHAKPQPALAPRRDQRSSCIAHRYCRLYPAFRRVWDRDRIVEEHHVPIARELVECALKLADQRHLPEKPTQVSVSAAHRSRSAVRADRYVPIIKLTSLGANRPRRTRP